MKNLLRAVSILACLFPNLFAFSQAPIISSFTPETAPAGSSVTINGNNFDPIAMNNIVYFGTVRAVVNTASLTQLNVTVPSGAASQHLQVMVNQLTAFSSKSFLPTFPGGPDMTSASFFATGVDAATGSSPYRIAISDLDGDGKPDMVATNSSAASVSVLKNNSSSGNISFGTKSDFPSGAVPQGICINDLNGDTKPDIIVTNYGAATVTVLLNTTSGATISFASAVNFASGNAPTGVAVNDIDGDGKPDIIIANSTSHTVSVLRNTSSATLSFAAKIDFVSANGPTNLVLTDVNEDGKPDIAVSCQSANTVDVFKNTSTPGTISFDTKISFTTALAPRTIVSADLDGDGKADLVTANYTSGSISMLRNTSSGGGISFAAKIDSSVGSLPENLTTGDFNGDGKPDIVVVHRTSNTMSLYRGVGSSGTIALSRRVSIATASAPFGVLINDIDLDGKPDISVLSNFVGKITVYRSIPPPKIISITPLKAVAGSSVTINGYNFGNSPADNIVYFGASKGIVTAASGNSLTVTVPTGATYAPPTVMVNSKIAYAPLPFNLVFAGSANLTDVYAARKDIPTADVPADAVLADLNGDGKNDMITGNPAGTVNIRILPNISTPGNISFDIPGVTIATVIEPDFVTTGDFDGDDKPDIVIGSSYNNAIKVARNNGNFSFTLPSGGSYNGPVGIAGLFIHDVNVDGKPDIVSGGSYGFTILQNTSTPGNISFATAYFSMPESYCEYAIGDLDQDGKVDIVAGKYFLRNTTTEGVLAFAAPVMYITGMYPASVAIGDLNNDDKPDIAAIFDTDQKIVTFANATSSGIISFARQTDEYLTGPGPKKVIISDLNGDGKNDVGVACVSHDAVNVFANSTSGLNITFINKVDYATQDRPYSLHVGDIDGDGKVELIAPNWGSSSVTVLRYAPYQPLSNVPTIVSFTPVKAPIGSVITINGTNFSTSAGDNIVRFGVVKAEVITASANTLTVKVPGGTTHDAITVTNADGYTAYSGYPFHTTFYGGGALRTGSFTSYSTFTTGTQPFFSIAADLDNDGKNDLIAVNKGANSISVLRNTTVGKIISFAAKSDYPTGNAPQYAAAGDLDGDGLLDVAVTNSTANSVSVFRNTSAGAVISFAGAITLSTIITSPPANPKMIAIRDFDGDGKPDIVIAQTSPGTASFFRNVSTGGLISFAPMVNIYTSTGSGAAGLTVADFDSNGKIDLMTSEPLSNISNTSIPGAIAFTGYILYNLTSGSGYGVSSVDINSDGKTDVLHLGKYNANIAFTAHRNKSFTGTQLFEKEGEYGNSAYSIISHAGISDMNGDGRPDVVLVNGGGVQGASIFRNRTGITGSDTFSFAPIITYPFASTSANSINVADLDNDGKAEIIITNSLQHNVAIARNLVGEPLQICTGSNATFQSGLDGSSFQWQMSTDSLNFTNISDNTNFTGSNTSNLQVNGMSTAFHNYQFRCVSNTATSEVFHVRFGNTWTGTVNNQWENPANWSCGFVPDIFTDVTVNAGANIIINSNVTVASLTVNIGAVVTVNTGFVLTLSGK